VIERPIGSRSDLYKIDRVGWIKSSCYFRTNESENKFERQLTKVKNGKELKLSLVVAFGQAHFND